MQIFAIVVSLAITAVGLVLFVRAIREIVGVIRVGTPAGRTDNPVGRTLTLVKETLGHTRMLQWTVVGVAHWFIFVGFGLLFLTLVTAFGQLFDAEFALPLIGHFFLWEWVSELFTVAMIVAITGFIYYRATRPRERVRGPRGRFFGSTMWQGYFVEGVILGVGLCIITLRGLEYALLSKGGEHADQASAFHFPFTFWLGEAFSGLSTDTLATLVYFVAMLKIVISFAWMITIALNTTMGVAWHRFTVFFNIWFKRDSSGRTALGAVKPLTSAGKAITLDDIDELDEDSVLGAGSIEDFSWKGILDLTSCTECGRCQSQCPAWNTEKPLSPKLMITALRDHAYAKAPYLQAAEGDREALLAGDAALAIEAERPLVGPTGDDWFYMPENGSAVIDPDVLWSCTNCGACVQQCPVDIEHVDHIIDMRRYAVLVESNFPAELNGLFKGLENKGNPWNMSPTARLDWTKGLDFEVKVVGDTIESLDEVEWLFWVGCAGAYEDRAKKTTRAVAELLDMAGVSFGVLGNGETCTGDPARRAGNEFVFQGLAQQNVETFKEHKVKKVVSTCAHCFNTLKNEYKDFGIDLEVVHHTQLLNRLVREGKLTPVKEGEGAAKRSITYHDPCFIGRHNGVYTPPRELLQVLPGAEVVEMERNSEKSFCCGAGGARMWMEENIGERINVNRTVEAVGTGADQIAVGCPFCRVMLSDGLTAQQAKGEAREEVEVLDVAQMLLASVKGESATKVRPKETAKAAAAAAAPVDEAVKAEPEAGDATQTEDTVTETEDVGPAAKASGGSSLFDTPTSEPEPTPEPAKSSGSLFDVAAPAEAAPVKEEKQAAETAAEKPVDEIPAGGSLFDLGSPAEAESAPAAEEAAAPPEAETVAPATQVPATGSLFDIAAPAPTAASAAAPADAPSATPPEADAPEPEPSAAKPAATSEATSETVTEVEAAAPAAEIPATGSLFDIAAPPPTAAPAAAPADAPRETPTESGEPEPEPEPEPSAAKPSTTAAPAPAPAKEIPQDGSLFDIAPPAAAPATPAPVKAPLEQETPAEVESETEPESSESPAPEPTEAVEGLAAGAAVSAAATFAAQAAAGDDEAEVPVTEEQDPAAPGSTTEEVSEDEPAAEEPADEPTKPKAADAGPAHQPKTDVDIDSGGSLFDL